MCPDKPMPEKESPLTSAEPGEQPVAGAPNQEKEDAHRRERERAKIGGRDVVGITSERQQ